MVDIEETVGQARGESGSPNLRKSVAAVNRVVVSAYKLVGFAFLTAILFGLVSYLGTNLFYVFSTTWVTPTLISPTDDRVIQISGQLAEQAVLRERLIADRDTMVSELNGNERIEEAEERFQRSFKRALRGDLLAHRLELAKLKSLTGDYAAAKREIELSNQAYSGLTRDRVDELQKARLIDRDSFVASNYQLSQIAHSNLSLAETKVDLEARVDALEREAWALDAVSHPDEVSAKAALTYEVLMMKREYDRSVLSLATARENQASLRRHVAADDSSLADYDRSLKALRDSPYRRAMEHDLTVAMVPYANLSHVAKGTPLYGCWLGFVWCHRVGTIEEVLPGEISLKHPLRNQNLRGVMVVIAMPDKSWVEEKVLFTHGPPLFP